MYRSNGLARLALRVSVAAIATLVVGASLAHAQGSLTTSDGLRIGLSASGAVTSLQSNGVEYANSAIGSGLLYRELPASPPNLAPNGSFETGTSVPTSWSW